MVSTRWFGRKPQAGLYLALFILLLSSLARAIDLQVVAAQAIANVVNPDGLGVVIAMDMQGQIIAQADHGEENQRGTLALNYRSIPGAVFRPFTVLAALSNGIINPEERISDDGAFSQYSQESPLQCWISQTEIENHQNLNYMEALYHNCYFFFYTLGARLGSDGERLNDFANTIGLTYKDDKVNANEVSGIVGTQRVLYSPSIPLSEQETEIPSEVYSMLIGFLNNISSDSLPKLESCAIALMDMAASEHQARNYQNWKEKIEYILWDILSLKSEEKEVDTIIEILEHIKWDGTYSAKVANGESRLIQCTPVSIARSYAMIANGGFLYDNENGFAQPRCDLSKDIGMYLPNIKQALRGNCLDRFASLDYAHISLDWVRQNDDMCSVLQGIDPSAEYNGEWYVCIAPYENPKIVVVAYTEDCGFGSAVSLVDQLMKAYFED